MKKWRNPGSKESKAFEIAKVLLSASELQVKQKLMRVDDLSQDSG